MAVISKEQREQEIKSREEMMTNAETMTEDEKKQLVEGMSVRDRLMRMVPASRVKTVIKDDLGDFVIVTRTLTSMEGDVAASLTERLSQSKGDLKVAREIFTEMRDFLGNVTVTPGVDWGNPIIQDHVVTHVFLNTLTSTSKSAQEGLASFRPV
jgi:hypothetical protein